jgi:hypothetical protein
MVWLWGSRAGSATTSTPVGKEMILSIGPTRSVDRAKIGSDGQAILRHCLRRCHSLWFS